MSIAGLFFPFLYIILLYRGRKNRETLSVIMLALTICVSLFVNIGASLFNLSFVNFSEYVMIFFVIFKMVTEKKYRIVKRSFFIPIIVFLSIIAFSFILLIVSQHNPSVIPFTARIDDVYHSELSTSTAFFSDSNINHLRMLLRFIVIFYFGSILLRDELNKIRLIRIVKTVFEFFFVLWTLEWIINNLISPNLIRNFVYGLFGIVDSVRTYDVILRWGFYGFNGLFTEPSYITIMTVYYSILWKCKLQDGKDWLFLIWSIIVLIINGSTSGVMIIPFGLIILLKNLTIRISKWTLSTVAVILFSVILLVIRYQNEVDSFFDQVSTYVNAYIIGGRFQTRGEISAAIREYGNRIAYSAFLQRPLVGVGLGTTRGYGILPGALANFGLVGLTAYFYFFYKAYNCKLSLDNMLLFIILLVYSTTILSVWYLYYPLMIIICIVFSYSGKWIEYHTNSDY